MAVVRVVCGWISMQGAMVYPTLPQDLLSSGSRSTVPLPWGACQRLRFCLKARSRSRRFSKQMAVILDRARRSFCRNGLRTSCSFMTLRGVSNMLCSSPQPGLGVTQKLKRDALVEQIVREWPGARS